MRKIYNLFIAAAVAAAITGCESADSEITAASTLSSSSSSQTEAAPAAAQQQATAAATTPAVKTQESVAKASESVAKTPTAAKTTETSAPQQTEAPAATDGVATVPDAVPFGALSWRYGGMSASGAKQTGVTISGLKMSKNGLSFGWSGGKNLKLWGLADGDAGAYACLFVQNASGAWVGGKFDWISSSRTSRDFINIYGGYGGWNLSDVPNPCSAAFVIVSADKKKRSNVLLSTWKR